MTAIPTGSTGDRGPNRLCAGRETEDRCRRLHSQNSRTNYAGACALRIADATLSSAQRQPDDLMSTAEDELRLRHTFRLADDARADGNHPFAAILVDPGGRILMESGNANVTGRDATAHAERMLASEASRTWSARELAGCTMYSSAEPCAMCAGAIYWSGIGRVVYGLSERRLRELTGNHPENPTLDLACRVVFESGQRSTEVIGPLLESEAEKPHLGFWNSGT